MQKEERLLGYMQEAVSYLLKRGSFESGDTFKPTQKEALEAYDVFLNDNARSSHSRLKGYFEIPTGIGKTAIFVGIVGAAHKIAKANGEELKTISCPWLFFTDLSEPLSWSVRSKWAVAVKAILTVAPLNTSLILATRFSDVPRWPSSETKIWVL